MTGSPLGQLTALPARIRWAAGAVRLIVREPADGLDRAFVRARRFLGGAATEEYEADPDWERRLHERLGHVWPCEAAPEFQALWSDVVGSLEAQGLAIGRGTYGGWDDADPGLARAVWCLTRHLRPLKVVETGVARGVTSRVILEALERNGDGQLWSIDLPALDETLHTQIAAAVPESLRSRWTYVSGTSRRRLPGLLAGLGEIDLFVHDSSHTTRNLRFELDQAWAALRAGAVVADDIQSNAAFGPFVRSRPDSASLVARADDGNAMFGIALKGV